MYPEKKLLEFFEKYSKTCDFPDLFPNDASLQVASTQLTSDQALLLLNWIRNLRAKKYDFVNCIDGCWVLLQWIVLLAEEYKQRNSCWVWNFTSASKSSGRFANCYF